MAKKKVEEKINLDSILFKCRDILRQRGVTPLPVMLIILKTSL